MEPGRSDTLKTDRDIRDKKMALQKNVGIFTWPQQGKSDPAQRHTSGSHSPFLPVLPSTTPVRTSSTVLTDEQIKNVEVTKQSRGSSCPFRGHVHCAIVVAQQSCRELDGKIPALSSTFSSVLWGTEPVPLPEGRLENRRKKQALSDISGATNSSSTGTSN
ncbi:hypothetical protein CB1_078722004 [Camelus ferus]|nr:hypothetical protein CB1_078722004 [Camelus ferus]